jgi:hypothetical protein
MLLASISPAEIRIFLLSHAAKRFEADAEDMRSFALKREALRASLLNRDEADAYLRAIVKMAGDRNLAMPWPLNGEI